MINNLGTPSELQINFGVLQIDTENSATEISVYLSVWRKKSMVVVKKKKNWICFIRSSISYWSTLNLKSGIFLEMNGSGGDKWLNRNRLLHTCLDVSKCIDLVRIFQIQLCLLHFHPRYKNASGSHFLLRSNVVHSRLCKWYLGMVPLI